MQHRKKKGRELSGWLALDKPSGITSNRALTEVKRLFQAAKAGHAGTLDPIASGCLPIAFGDATKTVPFVVDGRKSYRFTVQWGVETDTDDSEGRAIAISDCRPEGDAVQAVLPEFMGEIQQVPPAFSAIKIDGERAYDLARDGEEVVLEPRPVIVHELKLVGQSSGETAGGTMEFEAECGKGTYVRALARDLGRRLGTRGHVVALRRLMVGPFREADLVTLDALREAFEAGGLEACDAQVRPIETALAALPSLLVGGSDVGRLMRGQPVLIRGREVVGAGPAYAVAGGRVVAVGDIAAGEFAPRRVFSLRDR